MKTLTEFSGTMIRMAARAEAEARKKLPPELTRIAPGPVPTEPLTAKPSENASAVLVPNLGDSVSDEAGIALAEQAAGSGTDVAGTTSEPHLEKPGEAGTTEDLVQPGAALVEPREEAAASQDLAGAATDTAKATPGGAKSSELSADEAGTKTETAAETSAVKEALDKAVAEATGTAAERLDRLREAVKATGRQVDRVRLVRVFSGEEPVSGATKIGEHQYIVDLMPASMKQVFERDEKAGRRGPKRPSGGKQKGPEGSLEGGFSMESLMQDRKSERGPGGGARGKPSGRPGGGPGRGRGGAGGARPGGGRGPPGAGRGPGGGKPAGQPK